MSELTHGEFDQRPAEKQTVDLSIPPAQPEQPTIPWDPEAFHLLLLNGTAEEAVARYRVLAERLATMQREKEARETQDHDVEDLRRQLTTAKSTIARQTDILAYIADCQPDGKRYLDEATALSTDYCEEQRQERESLREHNTRLEQDLAASQCVTRIIQEERNELYSLRHQNAQLQARLTTDEQAERWTKEKPQVAGLWWYRAHKSQTPDPIRLTMKKRATWEGWEKELVWERDSDLPATRVSDMVGEWQGPLTPVED